MGRRAAKSLCKAGAVECLRRELDHRGLVKTIVADGSRL